MPASIVDARKEELKELKAQKEQLKTRRQDMIDSMKALRESINSDTQKSLIESSESARGNRKMHEGRATFNMENSLEVEEARLELLNVDLEKLDEEIEALEEIMQ